jgi:DHA1 family tetracycline resistance protein-like MFS transporter
MSDRVGRRPVLIGRIAANSLGWLVFAGAPNIPLLFVGRIINGLSAGNYTVAQSCLVDLARDERERSTNIGLIGATFGIGFMVGPLLGGLLSTVSHSFPFWCTGVLATANAVLTYILLPETHKRRDTAAMIVFNPLTLLARAAADRNLRPLYLTWILFGFALSTTQSVFALYGQHSFNFDSFITGVMFASTGIFAALNQTVLLHRVWLKYFSEQRLSILMTVMLAVCFFLFGLEILSLFFVALPLFATGQSVQRVVLTSQVTGRADPLKKGEALGILTSLVSATMVAGSMIGGALFEVHNGYPFIFACILMLVSLLLSFTAARDNVPAVTLPSPSTTSDEAP